MSTLGVHLDDFMMLTISSLGLCRLGLLLAQLLLACLELLLLFGYGFLVSQLVGFKKLYILSILYWFLIVV